MSTLRIKDAPLLPDVNGSEKIPTGGRGDYAVSVDQIKDYVRGGLPQQIEDHINDTENPHQVGKSQVGLGEVDNTSDVDKPISTATQEALDLKANQSTTYTKIEVDGRLGFKADKTYVDSRDLLKADKTYVDSALAGFSNGAAKFYPTLAAANADIANIALKDKVEVGEAVNGGTWYKATSGATSLTKSAYDPKMQAVVEAKNYADQNKLDIKKIQHSYQGGNLIGQKSARYLNFGVSSSYLLNAVNYYDSVVIPVNADDILFILNDKQIYAAGNGGAYAFFAEDPYLNRTQARITDNRTSSITDPETSLSYVRVTVPTGANYLILNTRYNNSAGTVSHVFNWAIHSSAFNSSYEQGTEVITRIDDVKVPTVIEVNAAKTEAIVTAATDATTKANAAVAIANADATTKANTAEANAKNFSKQLNIGSLKQGEFQQSGIGLLFTDRRGIPNWLQTDEQGMPTEFARDTILDPLKNRLLYNTSGLSGFVVSDRRGVALIDSDQSAVSVSNKYDLTTVKFHGSSTMRYMQSELFAKLKNEFNQVQTALYTNKNSGGTLNDLATEIGINDGLLKFTDNEIYAAAPSPVVGVGLKYGLPTTYDIPISLTNGFKGTLKSTGFVASNVTSDFELPVDLEINFKSDMTDYANCVSILNLGKNNMSGSNTIVVNNIVGMTRDAVTFLDKENGGHTLVIGHTTNRGSNVDFVKNVKDVNAQLKALYFKRYFGLFDYIFSDEIWIDTGLTKTAEDIAAIAAETLPPSLTNDGIHLNAAANSAVTTKIVQFIQTLGWY